MQNFFNFLKRNFFVVITVGIVFLIAGVFGYFFVNRSLEIIYSEAEQRLEMDIDSVFVATSNHFYGGAATLNAVRGFYAGSEEVTRLEFYNFIKISRFFELYPGFSTFAYIERVLDEDKEDFLEKIHSDKSFREQGYSDFLISPQGTRDEYWPIAYIYPEEEVDFLLGIDQHTEPVRSENIERACDTGEISVSGIVDLGQGGNGLILAVPLYGGGIMPESLEDRRNLFIGASATVIKLEDFFEYILSFTDVKRKGINISAIGRTGVPYIIYSAENEDNFFTKLYGSIQMTKLLNLGKNTNYDFTFKSPVSSLFSFQELFEPFLLGLIFFVAALFVSLIIIFLQRAKALSDLKRKYSFISMLSHQLRTPLTNLRLQLENRKVPKHEKETQQILMESVTVLNDITQRMLLFIEISEKGIALGNRELVSVERLYEKILHTVSKVYDVSRIERVGETGIFKNVLINEGKVVLAISYIIENALIYSTKEKKVIIELIVSDGTVNIKVTDFGYGIPKNEQKKVFSDFFRSSNASLKKNYGSGVSLFIAKQIIEAYGGRISFESEENKGSVFVVTLPLTMRKS